MPRVRAHADAQDVGPLVRGGIGRAGVHDRRGDDVHHRVVVVADRVAVEARAAAGDDVGVDGSRRAGHVGRELALVVAALRDRLRHGAGRGRYLALHLGDVAVHVVDQAGQVDCAAAGVVDDHREDHRAAGGVDLGRVGGLDDLDGRVGDDGHYGRTVVANVGVLRRVAGGNGVGVVRVRVARHGGREGAGVGSGQRGQCYRRRHVTGRGRDAVVAGRGDVAIHAVDQAVEAQGDGALVLHQDGEGHQVAGGHNRLVGYLGHFQQRRLDGGDGHGVVVGDHRDLSVPGRAGSDVGHRAGVEVGLGHRVGGGAGEEVARVERVWRLVARHHIRQADLVVGDRVGRRQGDVAAVGHLVGVGDGVAHVVVVDRDRVLVQRQRGRLLSGDVQVVGVGRRLGRVGRHHIVEHPTGVHLRLRHGVEAGEDPRLGHLQLAVVVGVAARL